jgi:hypothetical protein
MSLTQKFKYKWPSESTPIQFEDWVKTLSQSEQDEYQESKRNQHRLRQVAIDEGRLIMTDSVNDGGVYIWKDAEAFAIGKEYDTTWLKYWYRWEKETGVIFTTEIIEE